METVSSCNNALTQSSINMEQASSHKAKAPSSDPIDLARAPYMDTYPKYLSSSEREVRPALWASKSDRNLHSTTGFNGPNLKLRDHQPQSTSPDTHALDRLEIPPKAPILRAQPVFIPPAPRTEPNLPSFVNPRKAHDTLGIPAAPKTEPNLPSFVNRPNNGRPQYISPGSSLRALPTTSTRPPVTPADSAVGSLGTTSSFDWASSIHTIPRSATTASSVNINCYAAPPTNHACCCCCKQHKGPSRISRWKSAIKGLFHRDSQDESDLEHIETSHWTDT